MKAIKAVVIYFVVLAAVSFSIAAAQSSSSLEDPILNECLVTVKSEALVPADVPTPGAVLLKLIAKEGDPVGLQQELGQIDDRDPQMQKKLAEFERNSAKEQAENDINVRFATKSADVAKATYLEKKAANDKVFGTVTKEEMRRVGLDWQRTVLSIEQAKRDQMLAGITMNAREVDVKRASTMIERRQITAPIAGEVVEVMKHDGEWLNPGEPILRIVNFGTLRIDGFLNSADYDPQEVNSRPITVEVELARGRRVEFKGKVVYVSSIVETGGEYKLRAEVVNRRQAGQWLLLPGLTAKMTIHVNRAPIAEDRLSSSQTLLSRE